MRAATLYYKITHNVANIVDEAFDYGALYALTSSYVAQFHSQVVQVILEVVVSQLYALEASV